MVGSLVKRFSQLGIVGALGGFFAWLLAELLLGDALAQAQQGIALYLTDAKFGALVGVALGFSLGLVMGRTIGQRILASLLSSWLGLVGACAGVLWGEVLFQLLSPIALIARPIGWGLFGFVLGSSLGIVSGSVKGARRAACGGALAGAA